MSLRSIPGAPTIRRGTAAVVAVAAIAAGAQLSFDVPGSPVPQTAQTLAVLLTGLYLGPRWGSAAVAGYVGIGIAGLPVFANGASGFSAVTGPTGGFLVGFVLAAAIAGQGVARGVQRGGVVVAALAAHIALLLTGWGWLARTIGPWLAYEKGVAPFVWGALVKSLLAAGIYYAISRWRGSGSD